MSTNVIKQTLLGEPGSQTIKMVVRSNERGPKGEKGDPGPQGPQGLPGERGADGAIHYRAGTGINISAENIITATGGATAEWGGIQGDIADQTDLQNALNAKQDVMADFVGTNGIVDGVRGAVPAPTTSKETCVLMGKGGWRKLSTLYIKQDGVSIGSYYPPNLASTTVNIVPPVKIGSTSGNVAQLTDGADNNIYPVVTTGAIQDSAVTTVKINDGAVTAGKIDFTTFDSTFPVINDNTSNKNVNSDQFYDQYTYNVTVAGVYAIWFSQRMGGGATNSRDFSVRITKNGTEINEMPSGGGTYVSFVQASIQCYVSCTVGDVIKCQSKGGGEGVIPTLDGMVSIARIR